VSLVEALDLAVVMAKKKFNLYFQLYNVPIREGVFTPSLAVNK
jgi:hypothetical protein